MASFATAKKPRKISPPKPYTPQPLLTVPGLNQLRAQQGMAPYDPNNPTAGQVPAPAGQPTGGPNPNDPSGGVNYPVTPGPDTEATRIGAQQTYGAQSAGYEAQKAQAKYAFDDPANQNSAMAQIQRSLDQLNKSTDQRANAGNTFFSGINLHAHGELADQATRQRAAAKERYDNAVTNLDNLIAQARVAQDNAVRGANAQDVMNALAKQAAPQGGPGPANAPGAPTGPGGVPTQGTLSLQDYIALLQGQGRKGWLIPGAY